MRAGTKPEQNTYVKISTPVSTIAKNAPSPTHRKRLGSSAPPVISRDSGRGPGSPRTVNVLMRRSIVCGEEPLSAPRPEALPRAARHQAAATAAICLLVSLLTGGCSSDLGEFVAGDGSVAFRSPVLDTVYVSRMEDGFSRWSDSVGLGLPVQVVTSTTREGRSPERVVILYQADPPVRVLDRSGREILTLGGLGEGPGEFRRLGRAQLDSSHLWLSDPGRSRLSRWDRQGRLIEAFPVDNPQSGQGSFGVLSSGEIVVPAALRESRIFTVLDSGDGEGRLPGVVRQERADAPISIDHVAAAGESLLATENATGRLFYLTRTSPEDEFRLRRFRLPAKVTEGLDDILDRIRGGRPPGAIITQYVRDLQMTTESRAVLTFMRPLPGGIVGADLDLAGERMTLIAVRRVPGVVDEEYIRRTRSVAQLGECYLLGSPRGVERHCPAARSSTE